MKTKLKLTVALLIASTLISSAVLMSSYPGLDKAIDQADAIAVVRIEGPISSPGIDNISKQQCFVYQCLKGDLTPKKIIPILMFGDVDHGCFLVFLRERDGAYSSCNFPHAILRLSPLGNEQMPEGETIQAKIKVLLKRSIEYWDARWKQERTSMENLTGETSAEASKAADQKNIQGIWLAQSASANGFNVEDVAGCRYVFSGNKLAIKDGSGKEMKYSFKLDPGSNPKLLDLQPVPGLTNAAICSAAYELDGDSLKVAMACPGSRPTGISDKNNQMLIILKRKSP